MWSPAILARLRRADQCAADPQRLRPHVCDALDTGLGTGPLTVEEETAHQQAVGTHQAAA